MNNYYSMEVYGLTKHLHPVTSELFYFYMTIELRLLVITSTLQMPYM